MFALDRIEKVSAEDFFGVFYCVAKHRQINSLYNTDFELLHLALCLCGHKQNSSVLISWLRFKLVLLVRLAATRNGRLKQAEDF